MSFGEAITTCFQKYVVFTGRARRSEFWWFFLFYFLVSVVTGLIDAVAGVPIVGGIAGLALLLPSLGVTVRRLHDTDRTGWWILAPVAPAILGMFLMFTMSMTVGGIVIALALLIDLVILAFLIMPGTQGDNRFGSDPTV